MRLTFLGTSAGVPTPDRGVSALALDLGEGHIWLVDCGDGTQRRLLQERIRIPRIERILLTHLHGDHCFGLPALLATLGFYGRREPVEVSGPVGLAEWLHATLRTSDTRLPYRLDVHELCGRSALPPRRGIQVEAVPLVHRIACFAFVVREPPRRGHLDAERARALGVPTGPALGRLAAGEDLSLPDGRRVRPEQVLGPSRPGRVLALCGDSADSGSLVDVARGCDLLVHECTFAAAEEEKAQRFSHSTSAGVAALAAELRPRLLVLTHLSARYTVRGAALDPDALRKEVESRCDGLRVLVASDGLRVDVPLPEALAEASGIATAG